MEQVSFVSLADIHKDLKELFLQQQEALLDGDLTRAGNRLEEFEGRLLRHIRDEEEFLLPVYERAGAIPGGPPVLFTGEHKRWNATIYILYPALDRVTSEPERREILSRCGTACP